ncbi:hypothetical protein V496_09161 [Pseudogymnoascus sp. VKM F-4515 (FW-2607)]|nr:hypothetical protein V496_09161 [Pseudogymnoascus sp. VKM F-4515 (FW-2607)]KFY99454.1 hypothetical protein V498_00737 [Pseudogymnoascus sp. VKM F-4517 (FW-2822)]
MRCSFVLTTFFALATGNPTRTWDNTIEPAHLVKRASVSDKATLGYASLNGGTTGGSGGTITTVSTLPEFTAAVDEKNTAPVIVVVKGIITGVANVRIGSNKSIIGLPNSGLRGIGLYVRRQKNVIVRNIISSMVLTSTGDGIKIDQSTNVWVDHCEFFSALVSDKDFYDGQVDASHAADYITISYTYFHDHWKTSLIGHSDNNGSVDPGHLRITYAYNYWKNIGSRAPSLRFGTGHVYNSFFENVISAINSRMGAQMLVESNVFKNVSVPITSVDSDDVGYVTAIGNDLGGGANAAPAGSLTPSSIPYSYSLLGSGSVVSTIPSQAGAILTF